MKKIFLSNTSFEVPSIVVGCMRFAELDEKTMNHLIHLSLENGANFFDHADIYGGGKSEELFGNAVFTDNSIKREDMILQSKCGIVPDTDNPYYDLSKEHIIKSVENSLKRLRTDYLDILLLHRPDALVDPCEVAGAFDELEKSGKVRMFGVSNHKPMQIELLKKYVKNPLMINQLQFSLPVSNMVANGMEVNMTSDGSADRDGSVLDYSRLNDMTIQAWSPFQMPDWKGCFFGAAEYEKLNSVIDELAEKYHVSNTVIAAAWILRHPACMQVISGTTNEKRLKDLFTASDLVITREEWYRLYLAAGHPLP